MTIANQIIIQAHEGREKELKTQLNTLVAYALTQKGCQKFELYQYFDTPTHFFIVEIWKSERRYNTYLKSSDYLEHQTTLQELVKAQESHPLKLTQCLTELGLKKKEGAV